jgi:hypothetical protein
MNFWDSKIEGTYTDVCVDHRKKYIILYYIILFCKNACNPLFSRQQQFPSSSNLYTLSLHGVFKLGVTLNEHKHQIHLQERIKIANKTYFMLQNLKKK